MCSKSKKHTVNSSTYIYIYIYRIANNVINKLE